MGNHIQKITRGDTSHNSYCFVFVRGPDPKPIEIDYGNLREDKKSFLRTQLDDSILDNLRRAALFCLKTDLSPEEKKKKYNSLLEMISYGIQNEFEVIQKAACSSSVEESKKRIKSYEVALYEIWESYRKEFPDEEFPV